MTTSASNTQSRSKATAKKRKIHWPETVLPPINLWNAPILEHRYQGKSSQ